MERTVSPKCALMFMDLQNKLKLNFNLAHRNLEEGKNS